MLTRWGGAAAGASLLGLVFASPVASQTQERLQDVAEPSAGVFSQTIPIEVPAFHGVEPRVALSYSSAAKNGFPGAGWSLSGIGTVRATKNGRGVPAYGRPYKDPGEVNVVNHVADGGDFESMLSPVIESYCGPEVSGDPH